LTKVDKELETIANLLNPQNLQELEHSIFLLQIQKDLTKVDKELEKFANLLNPQNLQELEHSFFYCKFKKNWTTNWKKMPIFQYHKFGLFFL